MTVNKLFKTKAWLRSIVMCTGLLLGFLSGLGTTVSAADIVEEVSEVMTTLPNIIVILADDLGYGDISSFGAQGIKTPAIDKLADGGVKLTQFYAAAPVCSSSRAGLLTGRLPSRMGIRHVFMHDAYDGMPLSEITIAEQLKQAGYQTGLVGKWHLGHLDRYMPWNQGFDEFYGVPYSNDMANFFFYENQNIIHKAIDQRYLTRRYTEKATDYIERHAEQPFFLYLAHSMPHVPLYVSPELEGKSGRGLYGDVVQELDWSTGQIVEKLESLGLLDNTLIVFSSDNGPWLMMGDHGGSAGKFRDGKGSAFEGGQRVPTVAHWPAQINAGRTDDSVASSLDFLPTFSKLANVPMPTDRAIDGKDISDILLADGTKGNAQQFYYISAFAGKVVAYRDGDWKLKLSRKGIPGWLDFFFSTEYYAHDLLLFNLKDDPEEQNNIASQYPERVSAMQRRIDEIRQQVSDEISRELTMKSTGSDHKGYGSFIAKAGAMIGVILLLVGGLLVGLYKLIRSRIR